MLNGSSKSLQATPDPVGLRDYFRHVVAANPDNHLYESVVASIQAMLRQGAMAPGTRLPSLRALMQRLGISLSTGVRAYAALVEEGLVEVRPKSGYYVAVPRTVLLPRPRPADTPLDGVSADAVASHCRRVREDEPAYLVPRELLPVRPLRQAAGRVATDGPVALPPPTGLKALRRLVARHVDPAGRRVQADRVAIVSGWQAGLKVALDTIRPRHGLIAVESPTLPSILALVADAGFDVVEIPGDPVTGLRMDALDRVLAGSGIDALVCTPTHGVPSGSVMSGDARAQLLARIAARGLAVIEINLFGERAGLDPDLPSLVSADGRQRVINCGGFCHSLSPGYRVGWVASGRPLAELLGQATDRLDARLLEAPPLSQHVLGEYFRQRSYERHLLELRRALQFQFACVRRVIEDAFPAGTRAVAADGASAMWVQLPHGMDETLAGNVLGELGASRSHVPLRLIPGSTFSAGHAYRGYVCLALDRLWCAEVEARLECLGRRLCAYRKARQHVSHGRLQTGGRQRPRV